MRKKSSNPLPNYAKFSSIGMTMAVVITGGIVAGVFLDRWAVTGFPLFTVIFSLGAVCLAIYIVIREFLKRPKKDE